MKTALAVVTIKLCSLESDEEEAGQQVRVQPWTSGDLSKPPQGSSWKSLVGMGPAGKKHQRELVIIQRSFFPK